MTYNKPNDKTYVEMCIYFDKHIYDKDRDDTLLYQYLYHIIYMLACKKKYFVSWEDYDNFALYMATKVYMRYINPKHQGEKGRIKSVLNYCKNLLYPTKVDYQKDTFTEIIGSEPEAKDFSTLRNNLMESVQSSHRDIMELLYDLSKEFEHIPELINDEIINITHSKDKRFKHRIFVSVLLTLLSSITFSKSIDKKIKTKQDKGPINDKLVIKNLVKEMGSSVILWRLGPEWTNLVKLITLKVRKRCGMAVRLTKKEYDLSDDEVLAVLATAYGNIARDNNEEM